MKSLARSFFIHGFVLWLVSRIAAGIVFEKGNETLLLAAGALGLFNLFVRPLINILLLPINILTLGALKWVVNVATLYLVTLAVPGFKITGFSFPGANLYGIVIPSLDFGIIGALVAFSVLLSVISGFLTWLEK
ncbi:MAG: phage holin family protein [bacterium]|nr:phage holin family protein [bacterium]